MMNDDSADDTIAQIQRTYIKATDIHGKRTLHGTRNGTVAKQTVEIWEQPPDKHRREVLSSTVDGPYGSAGSITVWNGPELWLYDATENSLSISEPPGQTIVTNSYIVRDQLDGPFHLTLDGTATVADRTASVLSFTPKETADEFYQAYARNRIWFDHVEVYPLKQDSTLETDEGTTSTTETFDMIEFNTGVDESMFSIDPPETATIDDHRNNDHRSPGLLARLFDRFL